MFFLPSSILSSLLIIIGINNNILFKIIKIMFFIYFLQDIEGNQEMGRFNLCHYAVWFRGLSELQVLEVILKGPFRGQWSYFQERFDFLNR